MLSPPRVVPNCAQCPKKDTTPKPRKTTALINAQPRRSKAASPKSVLALIKGRRHAMARSGRAQGRDARVLQLQVRCLHPEEVLVDVQDVALPLPQRQPERSGAHPCSAFNGEGMSQKKSWWQQVRMKSESGSVFHASSIAKLWRM